jgi:hypothetical protein
MAGKPGAETEFSGDMMRESLSPGEPIVKLRNADRNVGYLFKASCTFCAIELAGEEIRLEKGLITCHCQKCLSVAKKRASELAIEILTTQRCDEGRRMPASSIKRVEAARSLVGAQGQAGSHKIAR